MRSAVYTCFPYAVDFFSGATRTPEPAMTNGAPPKRRAVHGLRNTRAQSARDSDPEESIVLGAALALMPDVPVGPVDVDACDVGPVP